jgi:hypothetical protein
MFKNKRNESSFNMIAGTENKTSAVPITYGKKHFPERDCSNDHTINNPGSKFEVPEPKQTKRFHPRTPAQGILP